MSDPSPYNDPAPREPAALGLPAREVRAFQAALLAWAAANGRRLAFRETDDPYRVLVAETMAQQTQVSRVEPAVQRFLTRFPTVAVLADAPVADVLREWRGLGYNRRALNLQHAARTVVERHGGRFPSDVTALEALPGVGKYTARAIAVHAFGRPLGPVDTNVRRVLTRVAAVAMEPRALQALADRLVPPDGAAAWTNAVMDLGSSVCGASRTTCSACPVSAWCRSALPATARSHSARNARRSRGRAGSVPPLAFARTTRWLRGRILDRLRDAPDESWASFDGPMGDHGPDQVMAMLSVLAAEGLLERHATAGHLARLPR